MASSTSISPVVYQNNITNTLNQTHLIAPPPRTQEQFTLLALSSQNIETKQNKNFSKIIKNQLREWQSVAFTRMAELRKKINLTPSAEAKKDLQDNLNLDRVIVDEGYSQLKQFISNHLDELPIQQEYQRKIVVLTDSTQQMQGVISVSIKSDHVFVNALLSAPWNNSMMKSPLPSEYTSLVKRGVGKALMAEAYRIAKEHNKSLVKLLPLGDSDSFYSHIGMEKESSFYIFSVSDKVPTTLLPPPGTSIVQNLT